MTEEQANAVASALNGYSWQSGGGIYVVLIERKDDHVIAITDECICEYKNMQAFDANQNPNCIDLT